MYAEYRNPEDPTTFVFSGTIDSNGTFSQDKFQAPNPGDAAYDPVVDEMPLPMVSPQTVFTVPSMPQRGAFACMFTLNWDPWTFSSDHSIPFAISGQGRERDESWKFNPQFPNGVSAGTIVSTFITSYTSSYPYSSVSASMTSSPPRSSYASWEQSQNSKPSTETAVGASFGAILGLGLVGAIFYACCKASHKENQKKREIAAAARSARGASSASEAPQRRVLRPGFDTDGTIAVPPPSYAEVIRTTRPPPRFE
jgi:hypothetical protein